MSGIETPPAVADVLAGRRAWCVEQADVLAGLASLPDECVQTVVTSPPYFGLRNYGVQGQIGLEETPDAYVARLIGVFREVRRALRNDGVLWLNLGDCYAGGGTVGRKDTTPDALARRALKYGTGAGAGSAVGNHGTRPQVVGLKPKDLIGMPWRVAFALQADGWYLRSDIIWHKPNPMPESVRDRPTRAHEYLFLLSKRPSYYYDADAIREEATYPTTKMPDGWDTGAGAHGSFHRNGREKGARTDKQRGHGRRHAGFNDRWDAMSKDEQGALGRNKRSVWTIATQPFAEAHFATFPAALVEPCILAGSSERGCCPACGAPWRRVTERRLADVTRENYAAASSGAVGRHRGLPERPGGFCGASATTTGWEPSCACDAGEPVPCVVLDPFAGSGTVGVVALRHGRRFVGFDLNEQYVALARARITGDAPLLNSPDLHGEAAR